MQILFQKTPLGIVPDFSNENLMSKKGIWGRQEFPIPDKLSASAFFKPLKIECGRDPRVFRIFGSHRYFIFAISW
jgi:hypothetical protein